MADVKDVKARAEDLGRKAMPYLKRAWTEIRRTADVTWEQARRLFRWGTDVSRVGIRTQALVARVAPGDACAKPAWATKSCGRP